MVLSFLRRSWRSRALSLAPLAALILAACSTSPPPPPPAPPARPASAVAPARPEALVGHWLFEMKRGSGGDPIQYSLHFSMTNGIFAGSLTGPDGNAREVTNIVLTQNNKVAWDVEAGAGTIHYDGTLDGSSMKGTAKRAATRRSRGSSDGESGDGSSPPPSGSGGYGRGGGGRGRGGRGGSRSGEGMTWSAYKSVLPESPAPAAKPTPSSSP